MIKIWSKCDLIFSPQMGWVFLNFHVEIDRILVDSVPSTVGIQWNFKEKRGGRVDFQELGPQVI